MCVCVCEREEERCQERSWQSNVNHLSAQSLAWFSIDLVPRDPCQRAKQAKGKMNFKRTVKKYVFKLKEKTAAAGSASAVWNIIRVSHFNAWPWVPVAILKQAFALARTQPWPTKPCFSSLDEEIKSLDYKYLALIIKQITFLVARGAEIRSFLFCWLLKLFQEEQKKNPSNFMLSHRRIWRKLSRAFSCNIFEVQDIIEPVCLGPDHPCL